MKTKNLLLAAALVLTTSSNSFAYLVPGQPGYGQTESGKPSNDPNRPGQYYPPPSHGGGGSYYPPPSHGGGSYYPPPSHGGGSYYPPPSHGGGSYYPPPSAPHYPPPSAPYYPPTQPTPPPYYGQRIVQQVAVNRAVQNEMFQLSYYANLTAQFYGWQVTAVRAVTRPNSPYTTVAQLMLGDNCVVASQTNPGYQISLFPNRTVIAGDQEIFLYIQGSTYIQSIEVELLRQ